MNIINIIKFIGEKRPEYAWDEIKYDLGKIPSDGGYKDKKGKQGPWEEYEDDGSKTITHYKDGKQVGIREYHYRNGQLKERKIYDPVTGKRVDGPYEIYHANGKIKIKSNIKNGAFNGDYEDYHKSGELLSKGHKIDNIAKGVWEFYHENGQLKNKTDFDTKKELERYDELGNPVRKSLFF